MSLKGFKTTIKLDPTKVARGHQAHISGAGVHEVSDRVQARRELSRDFNWNQDPENIEYLDSLYEEYPDNSGSAGNDERFRRR